VTSTQTQAERIATPALPTSAIVYTTIAVGLVAMWPSAISLARYWEQIPDYEHGFIIAAISLAWLLLRRHQIDAQAVEPRPLIAVGLLAALMVWLIAYRGISHLAYQLLLPAILWLAVLAAAGDRVAKQVAAPLAYLVFAVPVWDYLLPALQQMTVAASELGLGLIGVPVTVVGDLVTIPEGTFEIVDGCSGKRYFIVTLAFASLVGVMNHLSARRQLVLFLGSAAAALIANWIRVIIVIYAGHVTHMQHYWITVEHFAMGNVIFGVLLVVLLVLTRWLARTEPTHTAQTVTAADARAAASHPASVWLPLAMLVALGWVSFLWPSAPRAGAARLAAVPVLADRWSGPLPARGQWQPHYAGSVDEVRVAYHNVDRPIEVYVNLYTDQTPERKLVYHENSILTPHEWQQVDAPRWWESVAGTFGGAPLTLTAQSKKGERWIVMYAYVVAGRMTTNAFFAQLYYGLMSLAGPVASGVIALAANCETDCVAAREVTASFWDEESKNLASLIPRQVPRALESRLML